MALAGAALLRAEELPDYAAATVILANRDDPESLAIADAYQAFRGIPELNVLRLSLPTERDITVRQYVDRILNPLRSELFKRGLLNGDFVGVPDVIGRRPVLWVENKVRYLVLCRGVPLRIKGGNDFDDSALFDADLEKLRKAEKNPGLELPREFKVRRGSVDSELALLAVNETPITGMLSNPLRQFAPDKSLPAIVRVARLDGPSNEAVLRALEGVRIAERDGLKGRAYFDLRGLKPSRGGHYLGDQWIDGAVAAVRPTHFDLVRDDRPRTFGTDDRFDAPAIYVGWYTGNVNGPFTLPDFRFPPGAVAMHLHSYSAANPQSLTRGWVGALVEAGAAVTLGNVYEPYLTKTHQFDVLIQALVDGHTFGDAAFHAIPSLSWQSAIFGDPLYRPFKVTLAQMLPDARQMKDPMLDPYVIMREMNRLGEAGKSDEALALGTEALELQRDPALALHVAKLERLAGEEHSARRRLSRFGETLEFEPQEWMLYVEIARELEKMEASREATAIFRHLLADERTPVELQKVLLAEGSASALWTDPRASKEWKARLEAILEEERLAREAAEAKKRAEEEAKKRAEAEAKQADEG